MRVYVPRTDSIREFIGGRRIDITAGTSLSSSFRGHAAFLNGIQLQITSDVWHFKESNRLRRQDPVRQSRDFEVNDHTRHMSVKHLHSAHEVLKEGPEAFLKTKFHFTNVRVQKILAFASVWQACIPGKHSD